MSYFETIKLALTAIAAHKLRSFLTLLGVIVGVATVIVVVSLIEGFNSYVDEKISDLGPNAIVLRKYSIDDFSSLDTFQRAQRRNKDIKRADLEAIQEKMQTASLIGAQTGGGVELKRGDETLTGVAIAGRTATMMEIQRLEAQQGSYFTSLDEEHKRQVCFIGSEVADRLFPKSTQVIGEEIKIDSRVFTVVGISKSLGSAFGNSRDKFVDIPLSTYQKIYGSRRSIAVYVQVADPKKIPEAVDELRALMRARRHVNFSDPDNFGIITTEMISNLRQRIFGTIQMTAIGVTSIALVVGGIVIMNIMLVAVTERTREIGIRKALGAHKRHIINQFLAESFFLALIGGAIGITIAYLIAVALATFTPLPTRLPLIAVGMALAVSGGVGILSGVYPAWRAASLDPVRAMRAE
ncbi:MAG: ABC transporter permease [Blastocatellia bacterium]|nr:ABC transporter permease [Blastocatellia bacterium]